MTGWGNHTSTADMKRQHQRQAQQMLQLQESLNESRGELAGAERRLTTVDEALVAAGVDPAAHGGRFGAISLLAGQKRELEALVARDELQREAEAPSLATRLARYLEVREHTLSTADLTGGDQLCAEALYVQKEALELHDAVDALASILDESAMDSHDPTWAVRWAIALEPVRHELADVVLSATCLAGMLPGDVAIEACIEEKTEFDRGRG